MDSQFLDLRQEISKIARDTLPKEVQPIIANSNLTNLDLILQLCEVLIQKLNIEIIKDNQGKARYIGSSETAQDQSLLVFGAQLIYLVRQFFQDEEIIFHFGVTNDKGQYLADAMIKQSEVLSNFQVIHNQAIGLSTAIQQQLISTASTHAASTNLKRVNQWSQVEKLSQGLYIKGSYNNVHKIDVRKTGAKRASNAYQSAVSDKLVYLKFSYKKPVKVTRYYDKTGGHARSKDDLQFFNRGWLWEWYNSILYGASDEDYIETKNAIDVDSIFPIIKKQDNIRGTKQGDFTDSLGRQIQSKYTNEKIISYNSIMEIVKQLYGALSMYKANKTSVNNIANLIEKINEYFIPKSAEIGTDIANNSLKSILQKLNTVTKSF